MDDLINRQAIHDTVIARHPDSEDTQYSIGYADAINDVLKDILYMPSAGSSEIIQCKDCKWCREHYDTDRNAPYWVCTNWDGGTDADGFCHEAERRTDE